MVVFLLSYLSEWASRPVKEDDFTIKFLSTMSTGNHIKFMYFDSKYFFIPPEKASIFVEKFRYHENLNLLFKSDQNIEYSRKIRVNMRSASAFDVKACYLFEFYFSSGKKLQKFIHVKYIIYNRLTHCRHKLKSKTPTFQTKCQTKMCSPILRTLPSSSHSYTKIFNPESSIFRK